MRKLYLVIEDCMFAKANDIVIDNNDNRKYVAKDNHWVIGEDFDKYITKKLKLKKGCESYGSSIYKDKVVFIGYIN